MRIQHNSGTINQRNIQITWPFGLRTTILLLIVLVLIGAAMIGGAIFAVTRLVAIGKEPPLKREIHIGPRGGEFIITRGGYKRYVTPGKPKELKGTQSPFSH